MVGYVLLYEPGTDNEGIHSLELRGDTVVLMFQNEDDAERYCLLLEAQDFPKPVVEKVEKAEIIQFCSEAGYEFRFIEDGFIPKNEEERLLLVPPQQNKDVSSWQDSDIEDINIDSSDNDEIDEIKRRLEGLL